MKHLGDITKLNGAEIEPVDCVTGGSPCQDLSVAGKRAGLAGARSGLFMEQARVIREMRDADRRRGIPDELVRPRYMVWENVPGAFSSNGGRDFAAVLEETVRIACPEAPDVPVPEKGWPHSGCLYDGLGGWSVAWRVHDAQFWGVPQRRKRIALVADFGGLSAPEVLFERKGLSGDTAEGGEARQGAAGDAEGGAGAAGGARAYGISAYGSNAMKSGNPHSGVYEAVTARTLDARGGDPACNQGGIIVMEGNGSRPSHKGDGWSESGTMYTLNAVEQHAVFDARGNGDGATAPCITGDHEGRVTDYTALCVGADMCNGSLTGGVAASLTTASGQGAANTGPAVLTYAMQGFADYRGSETASACKARDNKDATDLSMAVDCRNSSTARRLTPLECERLQGYPDGWTDIGEWTDGRGKTRQCTDGARYKALGNSIALPFWFWLLRRISAQYERPATLGSLFDGIGGFPLCWERCNGKGTALWASEIEDFAVAVTGKHFPEQII